MNGIKRIVYILLLATTFNSCIRDEIAQCPPLQVNIAVKDKNYFNVDNVRQEERLSEDLAFCQYIPTLYYILRDATTGKVVEEKGVFAVMSDEKIYSITFCDCLPHGKYVLTVWGGLDNSDSLDDERTCVILHPDGREGNDIYMTNDTLVYDAYSYLHDVDMERTKGKLIIQATDLPDAMAASQKRITGLYRRLDLETGYSEVTSVDTRLSWDAPKRDITTKTLLAPSIKKGGTVVDLNFYDRITEDTPVLIPEDVNITMQRNELTVLRYVWDDAKQDFLIYLLVNDNWEQIHGMEVD